MVHGVRGFLAPAKPPRIAAFVVCSVITGVQAWAVTAVHRPYLQNVHETGATIVWSTRENVTGTVQYSADQKYSLSAPIRTRAFQPSETKLAFTFYQYQAELDDLTPGTDYYYRIVMNGENLTTPESEHH